MRSGVRGTVAQVAAVLALAAAPVGCKGFGEWVDDTMGKEAGSVVVGAAAGGVAAAAGADVGEAVAIGVAAAAFTWASVEASERDKLEAGNRALRAQLAMSEAERAKLAEENRKLAVKVNDEGGRMIVDPATNKPVNDKVYTTDEGEPGDGSVGELDGYSVVFAG
jgi:hypothetical protein